MNKDALLTLLKVLTILLLFIGSIEYHNLLGTYKEIIDKAFESALSIDLGERIASSKLNYREGKIPLSPVDSLRGKGILVQSSKGNIFRSYTKEMNREMTQIDKTAEMQTVTRFLNPIYPARLDSIFTSILKEKGLKVETGILYSDSIAQNNQYTKPDMRIYLSSFHTDIIPLGLNNEMTVQAFVRFHPHWLLQKGGRLMLGIIILWVMLCGVYLFVWLRQR